MLVGISVAVMILMLLGSSGSGELDPSCGFTRAQGESRHCLSLRVQLYLNRKAGPHLGASILEETGTLNLEVLRVRNHLHKDMAGLLVPVSHKVKWCMLKSGLGMSQGMS